MTLNKLTDGGAPISYPVCRTWLGIHRGIGIAASACLLLILTGCNDNGRLSVKGEVSLDGNPLQEGFIVFLPQEGTPGPTAGAEIHDGTFEVDARKGVMPGKFRVEIKATRISNRSVRSRDTGEMVKVPEQFLPERYNTNSELVREIKAGQENKLEFELSLK